jgi:hypothetical protein
MNFISKTLILLLTSTSIYASCGKVQEVDVGHLVDCEGVFFPKRIEQQIRRDHSLMRQRVPDLEEKVELLEQKSENSEKKAKLWEDEAKSQAELAESRKDDFTKGAVAGSTGASLLWLLILLL